jgi:hypothetical protein
MAGGLHPQFNVVQRFRLSSGAVEPAVREIRQALAVRGKSHSIWEIGPSSTPDDLIDRLLALDLRRYEEDPICAGMVLSHALEPVQSDIAIERVETVEGYVRAFELMWEVFGQRRETSAERRARAEIELEQHRAGRTTHYLGFLQGEPVTCAKALFTPEAVVLAGGATLPSARGKGAYRATLAARYEDAVARGTPMLVVQAGPLSRPILASVGFETVCEILVLVDGVAS